MQTIEIRYDPYRIKTSICIDSINIATDDTYGAYESLKSFLKSGIPLQTWIEPIPGKGWDGILSAIRSDKQTDELHFHFYGRQIDFDDFKHSCEAQNKQRKNPVILEFEPHITLSDQETLQVIEKIKEELFSEQFEEIMAEYPRDSLIAREYQTIKEKYNAAKSKEFRVVFAGLFSSGKSLIINTLIHHDILPAEDLTCTGKICRVVHDGTLVDNDSALTCFDLEDNVIYPKELFKSDESCKNRMRELTLSEEDNKTFDYFELKVNLSHLYPNQEIANEFVLTIVDTPGTNSGKTRGQGTTTDDEDNNLHREITLDAITNQSKDMVVLCYSADQVENESLGDLIATIYDTSEKDQNSFCDRFLFVANKCDQNQFRTNDGGIAARKEHAISVLTNAEQLGIQQEEVSFIPQLFMSTAWIEYAIQKHVAELSEEEADSVEMEQLISDYQDYRRSLNSKLSKDNFMLARHSGNPAHIKEDFERRFNELWEQGNIAEALSIQTGIPCIARAIQDYLERYAIPFKVVSLLHTFDYFIEAVYARLQEKEKQLTDNKESQGETKRQREEAKQKKEEKEKEEEEKKAVKIQIEEIRKRVGNITCAEKLSRISDSIEKQFEKEFSDIRAANAEEKTYTSDEIKNKLKAAHITFDRIFEDARKQFSEFSKAYQKEYKSICDDLRKLAENIPESDTAAKQSATLLKWRYWSEDDLRQKIETTKSTTLQHHKNPIKQEKYKWYQLKKWWERFRAPRWIEEEVDYFSVEPLLKYLNEKLQVLTKFFAESEVAYTKDIDTIKETLIPLLDKIEQEIEEAKQGIRDYSDKIASSECSEAELKDQAASLEKQTLFLKKLIDSYEFGGNL